MGWTDGREAEQAANVVAVAKIAAVRRTCLQMPDPPATTITNPAEII